MCSMASGKRRGTRTSTLDRTDETAHKLEVPSPDQQWPPLPEQETVAFALARGDPVTKRVRAHGHGAVSGTISASAAKQTVQRQLQPWHRLDLGIQVDGQHLSVVALMGAANRGTTTSQKNLAVYERNLEQWVSLKKLAERHAMHGGD